MHEDGAPGLLQERLAGRLWHLDEIAEHGVVLDAQRPAAGLGRVARLQLRDHLARIDLQQPQFVEDRRRSPRARSAPSRRLSGSSSARRRRSCARQGRVGRLRALRPQRPDRPAARRGPRAARRSSRAAASPAPSAARSRGPPRSSASRDSARAMSGTRASARCRSSRSAASSTSSATASWRRPIAAMSVSGPASRSASRRAPPGVTVRSMVASRLPARSPRQRAGQLEIGARRCVDQHGRRRRRRAPAATSGGRAPNWVRST